jgi:GTPase SAR1 family protein
MNGRRRINVAVVGDRGVGKTSLITSAAQEVFSERPVPVLPPTRFPADFAVVSEPVDVIAFDTSSRPEDAQAVDETIKAADVVIVCFDAQRKSTLQRLRSDWLPRITHLRPAAPVIIACCKDDTEDTLPTDQIREVWMCRSRIVPSCMHGCSNLRVTGCYSAAQCGSGTACTAMAVCLLAAV